jgi:class 3 adenylate cyclase/tetratricopeptide (TPR) repeat protein
MKCPKCQFENREGAKFCKECGAKLELACPECGTIYFSDSKFCDDCGCDLRKSVKVSVVDYTQPQSYTPKFLADKIFTNRSSIEGERKLVTVLFADVANYTAMAEKLDPEEVHQIMDGCFKILMDEIHKYEGTINQFTGDGVMALFGAPVAHEDHAQRACLAALSIQEALKDYGELLEKKFGVDFKMRTGINSGSVVVGSIGDDLRMDYTAIGNTTNLAARMESLAQTGTILVSKNTYEKVSPDFDFENLGKLEVKGKEKHQEVFKLKAQLDRSQLGFTRKIYSEMVGRDGELDKLEFQVMKALKGEGAIVNIIGEAGIGKSRLIAELKKKEVVKKVALLEGRAISMGYNLGFHPIIDILKNWARIMEDDKGTVALDKLKKSIRSVSSEDLDEILPFVAILMGIKLKGRYAERIKGIKGDALEKLILKSIRDLLIKASEIIPLVIVIEDLHWSDISTIELMESLFRLVETQRIIIINVFRPKYTETSVRVIQTIKERFPNYYVKIELYPLDGQSSETLINNMLNIRGLPHKVKDRIIKRTGGNPFFIEEVVRSFIDEGAIVRKDKVFEVTEKINSVVIPPRINDVIMARIDRLEEKTRDLVKTASVIGRSFFYRILAEVTQTIDNLDDRLENLKEIQLIRDRIRLEELEYLFKHALAQESVYESILIQKRKALHSAIANSIESVFKVKLSEFYGMLAYHYNRAEYLDKAEKYLVKAGEEALRSSASNEALHYYLEALNVYLKKYGDAAEPEKLRIFEKNIAIASYNKGQWENAVRYINRVLERWGATFPKNRIIILFKLICDLLVVIVNLYFPPKKTKKIPTERDNEVFDLNYKKAISLVELDPNKCFIEYISTLKKLTNFDLSKLENGVGMWLSASGLFSWTGISFRLSRKLLDYNKDVIIKKDTKEFFYYTLFELIHNTLQGKWLEVKKYDGNLVELNLKKGEIWHVSLYMLFHGYIRICQGAFKDAEMLIDRLSEISEAYVIEYGTEFCYTLIILLSLTRRKLNKALNKVDEAISFMTRTSSDMIILYYFGFKAIIQVLLRDFSGANVSLIQAKELVSKQDRVPPIYISTYLQGQFLFDLNYLEQAVLNNDRLSIRKYSKQAYQSGKRALKNSKKYALNRVEVLRLMGFYFWLIGRQKKALTFWRISIVEAENLGTHAELARVYLEIGKRFFEKRSKYLELNGVCAEEYLKKARTLFENIGLSEDLSELEIITNYI